MAPEDDDDLSWMHTDDEDDFPPKKIKLAPVKRGRGKLILLEDIIKQKKKKPTPKRKKKQQESSSSSSDEDDPDELSKHQGFEMDVALLIGACDEEIPVRWGERVFRSQKPVPDFSIPENDTGLIARVLKFKTEEGAERIATAASMASNRLLLSWAVLERRCDEATVRWLFHQMAYSDNEVVVRGAFRLLCDLLKTRDGICRLEWLPSFENIMHIFRSYGYVDACEDEANQDDEPSEKTALPSPGDDGSLEKTESDERAVPFSNMRTLLQFLVPYFESRRRYNPLSTSEGESLVAVLLRCQLDRCLLSISDLLRSCLVALIYYFTEQEWTSSCEHISSAISRISPTFVNKLRIAKNLQATNSRLGSLQQLVVLQLLSERTEAKISSPEDVVSIFKSLNVRDDNCNFVILNQLLILADIYLWSDSSVIRSKRVFSRWLDVLKKCASQIRTQDTRQDAMKVRNWAAFLSQKYQMEKMQTNSTGPQA